jgi:hypothetical protein
MLATSNPNATKVYKEKLKEYIERDKIYERMIKIRDKIANTNKLEPQDKDELEELDFLLTAARLEAERQCGKLSTTPWSPKLKAANQIKRHWEMWCKQIKTGRDLTAQRKKINAEIAPHDPDNPTEEEAHKLLKAARKELKNVKANAKELREEFLIQRAETYMKIGHMSKAKKLKIILKAEARRKAFNTLKYIQGKLKRGGLNYLIIPAKIPDPTKHIKIVDPRTKEITYWESIFDQEKINENLNHRNMHHFSQAEGTPFTRNPLLGNHS